MDARLISDTLFGASWQRAVLTLSSGEAVVIEHVDSVLMPRSRAWLIAVVNKDGRDVPRLIDPAHVVTLQTEPVAADKLPA